MLKVFNNFKPKFTKLCYFNRNLLRNKLSTKSKDTDVINDGPIKYSKSPASIYKAKSTRTGVIEPRLWYEPYVLLASVSVFLLYFTVIREENDIDQDLNTSLYSRIAGLEELQLRAALEYNRQNGLDTEAIIRRLREIEEQKETVET